MDAEGGRVGAVVDRPRGNQLAPGALSPPGWFHGEWDEVVVPPSLPGRILPPGRKGAAGREGPVRAQAVGVVRGTATAAVVAIVASLLGLASAVASSQPAHRLHETGALSVVGPAVSAPPLTTPPVTAPPVTAPPVTAPPVTAPPVTAPPVTAPPVTAPPVTAPPVTAPPSAASVAGVPAEVARVAQGIIAALDQRLPPARQIPATGENVLLLGRWMAMEGGLWADNPLNTDLHAGQFPHQRTSGGQDTGTPIFPSMQVGIENAAATLVGNGAYAPILAQLHSGSASCIAFATAVIRSPWAASHYGHNAAGFCGASPGAALGVHGRRANAHHPAVHHPATPRPQHKSLKG